MICVIDLCQNNTLHGSTKTKPPFLPFDEPNLYNDYLLRDSECINHSYINFPCHCVLNQVDLDTNLLDNVSLTKVLYDQPKTKEFRLTQIKIEKNNKQKETTPKNKKIRI